MNLQPWTPLQALAFLAVMAVLAAPFILGMLQ